MDETKRHEHLRFDWFGFLALAAGIGGMQLMLDRGEQLGWFGSPEIVAELIVSIVGFYYFFAHSFTTNEPFVRFAIFRDRNFLIGCFFMMVMGLMLFSSMTLVDAVPAERARLSDHDRRLGDGRARPRHADRHGDHRPAAAHLRGAHADPDRAYR